MRRPARVVLAVVVAAAFLGAGAGPAGAADGGEPVRIRASIDGRAVVGSDDNEPVKVRTTGPTNITLSVTNTSARPVTISRVRLQGTALGVTVVGLDAIYPQTEVEPNRTKVLTIDERDLFLNLDRQAAGLLPARFAVVSPDRVELGHQDFVMDVRGEPFSTLALFGLLLAVLTIAGVIGIVVAVQRRTLGPNRLRRAIRFGFVGLGAGLTAVICLSVFRVLAPTIGVALPMTVIPMLIAAAVGWISPGPLRIDGDGDDDDDLDEVVLVDGAGTDLAAGVPPAGAVPATAGPANAADPPSAGSAGAPS